MSVEYPAVGQVLTVSETSYSKHTYVLVKVETVDHTKLHWLPREDCKVCEDIGGVHIYKSCKHWDMFYCMFCHSHVQVKYIKKGATSNG